MRSALVATVLGFVIGCPAKPAPIEVAKPRPPVGLDTSGYGGLDWGATADEVRAVYPDVLPQGDNLTIVGEHAGKRGVTTFELSDGKLAGISVAFDDIFLSMADCATVWTAMRGALDPQLGSSAGDNLAAYWQSATYAVTLACDPSDDGEVSLGMSYAPALAPD